MSGFSPLFILKLVKFLAGEMKSLLLAFFHHACLQLILFEVTGSVETGFAGKIKIFASELC